jgi:hypothetical protein
MKKAIVICALLNCAPAAAQPPAPRVTQRERAQTALATSRPTTPNRAARGRTSREWRPATYLGLTVGKSTYEDALRVLGDPRSTVVSEGDEPDTEVWHHYEGVGELPGKLIVGVDAKTKVIERFILSPESLTKDDAIRHFGRDYVITRYDFDTCLREGDGAPLYESPNGAVTDLEYRERGISISLNYDNKVNHIEYVSKPTGAASSKCKAKQDDKSLSAAEPWAADSPDADYDGWSAATYRGLKMGKSTYADMVRVLGEPLRESGAEKVKSHLLKSYFYKANGAIPGDLIVAVKQEAGREASGTIYSIELRPANLSKEELGKRFGDYMIVSYDADYCLGGGGSAPLYESVKGSTSFLEYRSAGMAVALDYRGKVESILYVSEPIGSTASKCKQ